MLTKSVSNSRGVTVGQETTSSFSVTHSSSVEVGGASSGIEVSAGLEHSISTETTSQLDNSTEDSCEAECPVPASGRMYMFQWS